MPNYSGIWTEQAVMQANGAGNWPNAPGAPTIGTATNTGDGGAVSVAFTAPTFAGIPAVITGYTVTSSPGGLTGTGASSPITVSGLTNGTAYTFTVQATNANGTGPASAASNSVTPSLVVYVEDVMSTYLYTGTDATQTITNGLNLSGKGGLVWFKDRSLGQHHRLFDTARGVQKSLSSSTTGAETTLSTSLTAFNSNGFTFGSDGNINSGGVTYVSWTFREQAKFFDIVTYTGDGTNGRVISHSINGTVGTAIVKSLNNSGSGYDGWYVRHRSATGLLYLNLTNAQEVGFGQNITALSDTSVTVGGDCNENGETYVMYIFAHNAGGFGLTGTDNVISCGSFTTDGSGNATVSLGYEPQWVLMKASSGTGSWFLTDNMRGMSYSGANYLLANTSGAEAAGNAYLRPTATGFGTFAFGPGSLDYIYIAIRRGPMAVPTVGTTVFQPATRTGTGTTTTVTTSISPVDMAWSFNTNNNLGQSTIDFDRLRGALQSLYTGDSAAEFSAPGTLTGFDVQNGYTLGNDIGYGINYSGSPFVNYNFKRAPSFFDEVCYTGDGVSGRTITHNLTIAPELLIVKRRAGGAANWNVGSASGPGWGNVYILNSTGGASLTGEFTPAPTSSVFSVSDSGGVNASGSTYVAYLFATCAGVSKVGSYTGTGTTQTINCGFTAGSRFILIKRTDSTGDWYVYDSARGITSGNDPYYLLNSNIAQVTNTDYVDTAATGFEISSTAPAAINASGGTFIFLAIA